MSVKDYVDYGMSENIDLGLDQAALEPHDLSLDFTALESELPTGHDLGDDIEKERLRLNVFFAGVTDKEWEAVWQELDQLADVNPELATLHRKEGIVEDYYIEYFVRATLRGDQEYIRWCEFQETITVDEFKAIDAAGLQNAADADVERYIRQLRGEGVSEAPLTLLTADEKGWEASVPS